MISRLEGILIEKIAPRVVLDVHGVGYELELPMSSFYDLPAIGVSVCLRTHLVIRDDAHLLIGFKTDIERALFRELIRVTGIGIKVGLAILSAVSVDEFIQIIQSKDITSLVRVPGIGKKTAERLTLELHDRLKSPTFAASAVTGALSHAGAGSAPRSAWVDAAQALNALGYKPADAERMIKQIHVEGMTTEELIRQALKKSLAK